ncbi:MAG: septum formation initiator family protein [Planctomycetales bacterium]|nr:septum formation initiator family protein [Planctomycetales bacterium]MCB0571359.1 septum formation initiator family protein [Phaeodactylibacter sp.]MCB9273262.1 septum formation initiator family protein [Lewinellaceae bacterium]
MANSNSLWQQILQQIPAPLRNKYYLILVLFFGWMIFFDKHDLLTQFRLQKAVNKMEQDKEEYLDKIEQAKQDRLDLEVNKEKFAREQYYMHKSGEEVYIMVEEDKE